MVVEINKHQIRFGFGLYFLGKAQKEKNTNIIGLLQSIINNPIADSVDLMFYSAKCEAELDEIKLPIKKRDFVEFLESKKDFDDENGILAQWSNGFVESIKGNFLPDENEKEGEETKLKKN